MLKPHITSASLALPLSVLDADHGDMLYSAQEVLPTLNPEDQDTDFICSHGLEPPCSNREEACPGLQYLFPRAQQS